MVSSKQIVLFSTFLGITNIFAIVTSMGIINTVYLNGQYMLSPKLPVLWCFSCIFSGNIAWVQTCVWWLIFMPTIFTITCQIMRTSWMLISSLDLNLPVTSLNIFTCGVVMSKSCIPRFNKDVNSQNGSHDIVAGYLLDSFQIIQVMFIWYSTQLLAISPHNSMWSLMITSAHSSIFLPSKNLFLYGINLISEIFYARGLLTMMIRIIYIQNDSLLSNWSIYNVLGFKLIKLVRLIPIPILLWPIYHLQPPPLLIFHILILLLIHILLPLC